MKGSYLKGEEGDEETGEEIRKWQTPSPMSV